MYFQMCERDASDEDGPSLTPHGQCPEPLSSAGILYAAFAAGSTVMSFAHLSVAIVFPLPRS
ncbi:hypothetical protein ACTWPT_54840 [Nonomuraea sp. 3N208]|uniref:hypothetical protein n=1 Tax=Nonomuraea sp. 3N208 TaxID=3457421 RepID=UPI003FD10799